MKILTIANQKGGTAKSTTAAALAEAAAFRGYRTLAIDLDPQGNLTLFTGIRAEGLNAFDLLQGTAAADVIRHYSDKLDVIPASWNLSTITTGRGSARRLQRALDPVKENYDLIIIDTPPTAGELQYNALQAATMLLIPLQADISCLQSLYQIYDTAEQIWQTNTALTIAGIVFARHNGRSTIARQMQQTITDKAAEMGISCLGEIRQGVAIQEAQALQQNLYEYAPKSKPAADYMELLDKILKNA